MANRDKILLYLDKKGKHFLVYNEKDLLDIKIPVEYVDNGTNKYIDTVKEKWEIQKVSSSKNKLTLEFKLINRKTE